jgi:hypothetical protein
LRSREGCVRANSRVVADYRVLPCSGNENLLAESLDACEAAAVSRDASTGPLNMARTFRLSTKRSCIVDARLPHRRLLLCHGSQLNGISHNVERSPMFYYDSMLCVARPVYPYSKACFVESTRSEPFTEEESHPLHLFRMNNRGRSISMIQSSDAVGATHRPGGVRNYNGNHPTAKERPSTSLNGDGGSKRRRFMERNVVGRVPLTVEQRRVRSAESKANLGRTISRLDQTERGPGNDARGLGREKGKTGRLDDR